LLAAALRNANHRAHRNTDAYPGTYTHRNTDAYPDTYIHRDTDAYPDIYTHRNVCSDLRGGLWQYFLFTAD
jgi:hypothetical protein